MIGLLWYLLHYSNIYDRLILITYESVLFQKSFTASWDNVHLLAQWRQLQFVFAQVAVYMAMNALYSNTVPVGLHTPWFYPLFLYFDWWADPGIGWKITLIIFYCNRDRRWSLFIFVSVIVLSIWKCSLVFLVDFIFLTILLSFQFFLDFMFDGLIDVFPNLQSCTWNILFLWL